MYLPTTLKRASLQLISVHLRYLHFYLQIHSPCVIIYPYYNGLSAQSVHALIDPHYALADEIFVFGLDFFLLLKKE